MITILTPTYNRKYMLDKAYQSLIKQTDYDFEWLVIDDGSNDNTKELFDKYKKENKIKIRYYYKTNGGKHTALNIGIKKAKGSMLIILDSDDILTNDAVETIKAYEKIYKNNNKICGFSFLKLFPSGKKIGTEYKEKVVIDNYINFRHNKNINGDMAEVFWTNILKNYEFPTFKNERFLSEAIVWNKIALKYDTVYINKGIYIADYIEDGLSNNIFKLVYKNPIGASENANMFLNKKFKLKIRLKNAILYDGYCLTAKIKLKELISNCYNKKLAVIMLPFGYLFKLFLYLKGKND